MQSLPRDGYHTKANQDWPQHELSCEFRLSSNSQVHTVCLANGLHLVALRMGALNIDFFVSAIFADEVVGTPSLSPQEDDNVTVTTG